MNFLIIHGAHGTPEEIWFPWLKNQLEILGHTVTTPAFPTPEGQTLANWLQILPKIQEDIILIGHSVGAAFILSILEHNKAKAAYFVAGFTGPLGGDLDQINSSFAEKEFDWEAIKGNCSNITAFYSENDPYVSVENAMELKEKLAPTMICVSDAAHFSASTGYFEFPQLLEEIKKITRYSSS